MRKTDRYHVDDDNNLSRITSNDSGISYDDSDDSESLSSIEYDFDLIDSTITITEDGMKYLFLRQKIIPSFVYFLAQRAAIICDDDKKYFCENTAWAWHGEFGRLIMATALTYNIDYRLMLYDARFVCPRAMNASYTMMQLDNAKAQFKCDICGHCWTSMRARCAFYISKPNEGGIVLLRLYTQQCQYCYTTVHPLWYFGTIERNKKPTDDFSLFLLLDEICRVMKNLAFTIFKRFFPYSISSIEWDIAHNGIQPVRRLLQRKGNMHAQHNSSLCEACHLGYCY